MSLLQERKRAPGSQTISLNGIELEINPLVVNRFDIADNAANLGKARARGVEPLSLVDIVRQLQQRDAIKRIVLFDAVPPSATADANHWRILNLTQNGAVLQHCGADGKNDTPGIYPVELPFDTVFFTGASFHEYKRGGQLLTLDETVNLYRSVRARDVKTVTHTERVWWSNGSRQLIERQFAAPLSLH